MSDQAFAAAARPTPQNVLRLDLLPYSIGHELLLQRAENPLLGSEDDFKKLPLANQVAAVMRAVLVCSRTWSQNHRADRWVRFWGWRIRNADFPRAIAQFRAYRNEGRLWPRFTDPEWTSDKEPGRSLGSPFMASLLHYCIGRFQHPFDQPLGFTQFLYFAQSEQEGNCKIENTEERETRETGEKLLADIRREQEAKRCPR